MELMDLLRALALIQLACAAAAFVLAFVVYGIRRAPRGRYVWRVVEKSSRSRAVSPQGPASSWVAASFALLFYWALPYWIWRWGWWRAMLALALPIACGLLLAQLIPSNGRGSDSLLPSAIAVGVMRGLLAYPIAAWDGRWRLSIALVRGWTVTAKIEAASSGEAIAIAKTKWDPLDDSGGWRRRLRPSRWFANRSDPPRDLQP